ncbi:MAG: DUF2974 domain-containing protein [Lachnospiraceae bacterium]|nr:DUF2974 domain-containing protein [Lachnospiraceae bacterium]
MANMFDYLKWRGDLTFDQAPLNEIDSLIFTWIAYVHFEGIVPEKISDKEYITLSDADRLFFETHDIKSFENLSSFTRTSAPLLHEAAKTERFRNIKLTGFINDIDYELEKQFSAATFIIPEVGFFVAFRGTDDTIVGWKEDFNIYLPVTPARDEGLHYLEKAASILNGKIYVGGHSKGGNTAVYAASLAKEKVMKRIEGVYNNDGPGFLDRASIEPGYTKIGQRIHTYVPNESIVGMLLSDVEKCTVIKSSEKYINQHDASSWEVEGNRFDKAKLSNLSYFVNKSIAAWVGGRTTEEIKMFIDTLFGVVCEANVRTTTEINAERLKSVQKFIKIYRQIDKKKREELSGIFVEFFKEGKRIIRENMAKNKGERDSEGLISKLLPAPKEKNV